MFVLKNEIRNIIVFYDIRPGAMMILHDISNNILISQPSYLSLYQDKIENLEIYQEINNLFGLEPNTKNCRNCGELYSCNNHHTKNINSLLHI